MHSHKWRFAVTEFAARRCVLPNCNEIGNIRPKNTEVSTLPIRTLIVARSGHGLITSSERKELIHGCGVHKFIF